jgi:uncharacterized protein (DUF983 family)
MARSQSDTDDEDATQTPAHQVCPECGHGRFSWVLKQVVFGTIDATDAGLDYHAEKHGHTEGDDNNFVMCQDCTTTHQPWDLIGAHEWAAREEERE